MSGPASSQPIYTNRSPVIKQHIKVYYNTCECVDRAALCTLRIGRDLKGCGYRDRLIVDSCASSVAALDVHRHSPVIFRRM